MKKKVNIILLGELRIIRIILFLTLLNIIFFTLLVLVTGIKYPLLTAFFELSWLALIFYPLIVATLLMVIRYIRYRKYKQKIGGGAEIGNPLNFITFSSLFLRLFFITIAIRLFIIAVDIFCILITPVLPAFLWHPLIYEISFHIFLLITILGFYAHFAWLISYIDEFNEENERLIDEEERRSKEKNNFVR